MAKDSKFKLVHIPVEEKEKLTELSSVTGMLQWRLLKTAIKLLEDDLKDKGLLG